MSFRKELEQLEKGICDTLSGTDDEVQRRLELWVVQDADRLDSIGSIGMRKSSCEVLSLAADTVKASTIMPSVSLRSLCHTKGSSAFSVVPINVSVMIACRNRSVFFVQCCSEHSVARR